MRICRLILAVLLAASLTLPPVSAAMAVAYAAKAEMSMSAMGERCACCDAAQKCATDACVIKCFNLTAISVEGPLVRPSHQVLVDMGLAALSPFSHRPDPPPPRL